MRVLLTGDRGYIGAVMAPWLQRQGHDVTGMDTDFCFHGSLHPPSESHRRIRKDIRGATLADLQGFDAVIHLAALSNDPLGDLKPELTFGINYRASVHLARLAQDGGVKRFLYASSCSLYGAAGDCSIEYSGQAGPDPRNYRVSFDKLARTFPHFQPRWNAREGARELCASDRAAGMTAEDFHIRKFTRLKQLKFLMENPKLDDLLQWTSPVSTSKLAGHDKHENRTPETFRHIQGHPQPAQRRARLLYAHV